MRHAFSYGYSHIAALTPVKSTVYAAFGKHHTDSCLCLIRIQAANLDEAGFGDTSRLTPLSGSWKGMRDDNKKFYFDDKISNSAGHK